MALIHGHDGYACILCNMFGHPFDPRFDRSIVNVQNGKLLGGVIYTDYTVAAIHMHAASYHPHWLSRGMLWSMFAYPFEQLGVGKIICPIESTNHHTLEICAKLGFIEEARIADVFPDGDMVIVSMTKAQCRWLKRGQRGKKE